MATKTITITEAAYNVLAGYKHEHESFSEEITRILSHRNKKNFKDLIGIISAEVGQRMLDDLKRDRTRQIRISRQRA